MTHVLIPATPQKSLLRRRLLIAVGAVLLVSLVGSTLSLYKITEVTRSFEAINRVSVPLERWVSQLNSDAEVLKREMERGLGYSNWKDPHWKPRPIPRWVTDVADRELERLQGLIQDPDLALAATDADKWKAWMGRMVRSWATLKQKSDELYSAILNANETGAQVLYPQWLTEFDRFILDLDWATRESEGALRKHFGTVQNNVRDLRTGLQGILTVVLFLSLLVVWLGERALRPLAELARLARAISERGLQKGDKEKFPEISLSRDDEVSQLALEFRKMATSLLEWEKTVESQKDRLQEQNRLLREMGGLNENILRNIESALMVADLAGRVTQFNPVAARLMGDRSLDGLFLLSLPEMKELIPFEWPELVRKIQASPEGWMIQEKSLSGRVVSGKILALRDSGSVTGVIVALADVTEEVGLQKRLRHAENLAAVGRMSAQVAHEVRNPLHSIGLEAELAIEAVQKNKIPLVKESLGSILSAVERLERITENYLKLSRLSSGKREKLDLGLLLEEVMAAYSSACESKGVKVDWTREAKARFEILGDRGLLEQTLGNLFRNALQAVPAEDPWICWKLGNTESGKLWMRIEDNGPGVSAEVEARLFDPFVTSKAEGTGLGLSFVKQVISEHGGEIRYVKGGQSGAIFEIILPLLDSGWIGSSPLREGVSV